MTDSSIAERERLAARVFAQDAAFRDAYIAEHGYSAWLDCLFGPLEQAAAEDPDGLLDEAFERALMLTWQAVTR